MSIPEFLFAFLPRVTSRLIKCYHVVSLCFDSLPALVYLTIFHCEFLPAISSSVQPLVDRSSEKNLFFCNLFILVAYVPSLEVPEVVCDL